MLKLAFESLLKQLLITQNSVNFVVSEWLKNRGTGITNLEEILNFKELP